MKDEEDDKDLKVNDRRRFVIDEKGDVTVRPEDAIPGESARETPAGPRVEEPPREKKRGFFRRKEKNREEPAPGPREENLPRGEIDFAGFVLSLSTSVMIHLGEVPDPITRETVIELPLAQQTIDILAMIREKTKGNLTREEEMLLNDLLTDLRMRFVEKVKKYSAK
ncbi:MAG: DUF1844 domain-containing protein [bacterium]|nr:DUF1844 domain-containing protein [bacterium]